MAVLTVGLSSEFDGFFHLLKKKKKSNKRKMNTYINSKLLTRYEEKQLKGMCITNFGGLLQSSI